MKFVSIKSGNSARFPGRCNTNFEPDLGTCNLAYGEFYPKPEAKFPYMESPFVGRMGIIGYGA